MYSKQHRNSEKQRNNYKDKDETICKSDDSISIENKTNKKSKVKAKQSHDLKKKKRKKENESFWSLDKCSAEGLGNKRVKRNMYTVG